MITEVAELNIKEGTEAAFLTAVEKAVPIFRAASGCRSMRLERVIETPNQFRLIVLWENLTDHTEDFRNSPGFQEWRNLVGGYFASPPKVDHCSLVFRGFE